MAATQASSRTSRRDSGTTDLLTPEAIRKRRFAVRMRGLDEDEVDAYLLRLADQIEAEARRHRDTVQELAATRNQLEGAWAQVEAARREIDVLRERVEEFSTQLADAEQQRSVLPTQRAEPYADDRAIALFEQAQAVVDGLMEDAVRRANAILADARRRRDESFYWETNKWVGSAEADPTHRS